MHKKTEGMRGWQHSLVGHARSAGTCDGKEREPRGANVAALQATAAVWNYNVMNIVHKSRYPKSPFSVEALHLPFVVDRLFGECISIKLLISFIECSSKGGYIFIFPCVFYLRCFAVIDFKDTCYINKNSVGYLY